MRRLFVILSAAAFLFNVEAALFRIAEARPSDETAITTSGGRATNETRSWEVLYPDASPRRPSHHVDSMNSSPGDTLRWDDGSGWTASYYFSGGNGWGVKFEPLYYPCRVVSLMQKFTSGWPDPGGDDLILWIVDDDGLDGAPGTILSADTLYDAITSGVWNGFAVADTGVVIEDGSFYGVYIQIEDGPNCPAGSFDNGYDENRGWSYYDGLWEPNTIYGDMLLRAYTVRAGGDAHDVGVRDIVSPGTEYDPAVPIEPEAVLKNWGTFTEEFYVRCQIESEGVPVLDDSVSVSALAPDEARAVSFASLSVEAGNVYQVTFTTRLASDVYPVNDSSGVLTKNYTVPRTRVLVEEATGTWCYYCQFAADGLDSLSIFAGDSVAIIAYHNSDPYSNEGSDARIAYYNITGYPTVVFDGVERVTGGGSGMYRSYRSMMNSELQKNVPVDLLLQGSYNDQTGMAFVQIDIDAVDGLAATDLRLFVVLTESHIAEEWFDKDSLHFVERDIFPDPSGIPIILNKGGSHQELLNFPVSGDYVDSNCEVVVFLQDYPTKEVLGCASSQLTQLSVGIGDEGDRIIIPRSITLSQNYPNPFNPQTTIEYSIPEGKNEWVELMIYDLRGRLIRLLDSGVKRPGDYVLTWDGRDKSGRSVSSGVYLYRLKVGGWQQTSKMLLLK